MTVVSVMIYGTGCQSQSQTGGHYPKKPTLKINTLLNFSLYEALV